MNRQAMQTQAGIIKESFSNAYSSLVIHQSKTHPQKKTTQIKIKLINAITEVDYTTSPSLLEGSN
jgi:hypothetical protein